MKQLLHPYSEHNSTLRTDVGKTVVRVEVTWQCYRVKALDSDRSESSLVLWLTSGCPGAIYWALFRPSVPSRVES